VSFALHPQLAADTAHIADLPLCRVLLMNNRHFPWLVLVPMRDNARELFDLSPADYAAVTDEIRHVAQAFSKLTGAYKINVAALGNMVPQLHIHIIARFPHDNAWPKPVWNTGIAPEPYPVDMLAEIIEKIKQIIA